MEDQHQNLRNPRRHQLRSRKRHETQTQKQQRKSKSKGSRDPSNQKEIIRR